MIATALVRLRGNAGLIRTAASLVGTTLVTSGLGFIYWWIAARMVPASVVGYGSAIVNAMMLVGTFGMLGLGTLLIGELEGGRRPQPGLVTACLIASGGASLVGGLAVLLALAAFAKPPFAHLAVDRTAWFAVGCALTASALVLDLAFVGSSAGGVQLLRNAVFSAAKLALLPVLIKTYGHGDDLSMLLAWIAGTAISLVALLTRRGRAARLLGRPAWPELLGRWRSTAAHNAFNAAGQVPRLLLPILATVAVSPSAGAAFFVAWMLVGLLYVIPTHFSTALFALGAGRLAELRDKLAFSLKVSGLFGLVAVPLIMVGARPAMLLFGAHYADIATTPLRVLTLSYFAVIVKTHYVAVTRVQGRLVQGAVIASAGAALEIVGAWVGSCLRGLDGMSVGICIGLFVEALVMFAAIRAALAVGEETDPGAARRRRRPAGRHRPGRHRRENSLLRVRLEVGVMHEVGHRLP
jgi:O-antigen/teichoic acid export membrane protein